MKKSSIIFIILIIFWALRDNVPIFNSYMTFPIVMAVLVISYFAFFIEFGPGLLRKYLPLFSVPIANLVYSLFDSSLWSFDTLFYVLLQLYIWPFISEFVLKYKHDKKISVVVIIVFLTMIITSITTYLGNLQFPGASRMMATGLEEHRESVSVFGKMNIGGFDFIYSLVLLLPFLFFSLRNRTDRIVKKLLLLSIIILFFITIYNSEYTTALLFSALSIVIFFLPQKISPRTVIVLAVISIPIMVFADTYLPLLFSSVSESTESYNISVRMEEMGYLMSGVEGYGDVQGRINLWRLSLNNFTNNLLTGTGNIGGSHSFILDNMSKYGIWGLLLIILQFSALYRITVKPYAKGPFFTPVLFMYIINFGLCLFNTLFFYNIFLFFIPLFIRTLENSPRNTYIE
jgi:hypothetical protein